MPTILLISYPKGEALTSDIYRDEIVYSPHRNAAICEEAQRRVDSGDFPGIIFVRLLEHGDALAQALSVRLNLKVPCITASVPPGEKESTLLLMRNADPACPVAVATATWSTGVDIPCLKWVMQAGAGVAPIGKIQEGGRALRPHEGKDGGIEIINVVDTGDVDPRWTEQARKREEHLAHAGYDIPDSELTSRLLQPPPKKKKRKKEKPPPPPPRGLGDLLGEIFTPTPLVWCLVIFALIIKNFWK